MNDLTVFVPEKTSPCIPTGPIRTIGIDLGTTNSAVAEAVFDPQNPHNIEVRCLEVEQLTEDGVVSDVTVPSVVALTDAGLIVGRGAKRLRAKMAESGFKKDETIFYECKNEMGLRRVYNAPEGFNSPACISGRILEFLFDAAQGQGPIPIRKGIMAAAIFPGIPLLSS
ncbi:MAG: hypothetical protein JSV38_14690 [Desulfobacterales bacterium]|nr:MAG: hypothetical protein JSV38_14690 [Desulfobacterales bacterium]